MAAKVRNCLFCNKSVRSSNYVKHLWAEHHEHMMKNRLKKSEPASTLASGSSPEPETKQVGVSLILELTYEIVSGLLGKKPHREALEAALKILTR